MGRRTLLRGLTLAVAAALPLCGPTVAEAAQPSAATGVRGHDINLRLITDEPGVFLDACVVFVDHTTKCNNGDAYTTHGTEWGTVATDVKDGIHFVLTIHAYDTDAQNVTFQIAY